MGDASCVASTKAPQEEKEPGGGASVVASAEDYLPSLVPHVYEVVWLDCFFAAGLSGGGVVG